MTLALPPRRGSSDRRGRTAIIDFGPDTAGWTGPSGVAEMLACAAPYIDYAKIYALNALLMPSEPLRKITQIYADAGVRCFSGGILFEWAYRQEALADLSVLLRDLGIPGLEISENYIRLPQGERLAALSRFRDEGFEVIYEFGRKTPDAPLSLQHLADTVGEALEAGAAHVLLEQSEIDLAVKASPSVLDQLSRESWFADVFLEVDPTDFPRSHVRQIEMFGAQVNLANVAAGQALRLEGLRRGIGRGVDYAMFQDEDEGA